MFNSRAKICVTRGPQKPLGSGHAGTGTAFDTVDGAGTDGTMDGIDDFTFGNRFAATDDAAIARIFGDEGFLVRIEHHAEARLGRTAFFIIGIGRSTRFRYDEVYQFFGDGRCDVRPGDWMPAAWRRPFVFSDGPTIKSPVLETARTPENSVIVAPTGILGTKRRALSRISSIPGMVTAVSSLSSSGRSWAFGPTKTLPWVVAQTRIPLPILVGVGKIGE